jgi:hypothetical protein
MFSLLHLSAIASCSYIVLCFELTGVILKWRLFVGSQCVGFSCFYKKRYVIEAFFLIHGIFFVVVRYCLACVMRCEVFCCEVLPGLMCTG